MPETPQDCKVSFLKLVKSASEWKPPAVTPDAIQDTTKPEGDDGSSDPSKGVRGSERLLKILSPCPLYRDDTGAAYIQINSRLERLDVKGRSLLAYLSYIYYTLTGKAPGREAIGQAIQVLEGKALHEGTPIELFNRIGEKDGVIYYYMGRGRCVAISAGKWELVDNSPVFFLTFNHQHLHPEPIKGGDSWQFFKFFNNIPEEKRLLMMVIIISCFIPKITHPILNVIGSHGAGKSFFCGALKTIIDPSASTLISMPRKEEDIDLLLYRHHLVALDNLSELSGSLSDRLSNVITGAVLEKRQLHTDTDVVLLRCNPVIILNGIVPFIHRPDLLDRAITVNLERITSGGRREERELRQQFYEALPSILGGIFDTLSKAIEIYPTVKLNSLPRLADFCRWGFSIAEALGGRGNEFIHAYSENASLQIEEMVEGNTLFSSIMNCMETQGYLEGTFKETLDKLREIASPSTTDKTFPPSPRSFRGHLERLRTPLSEMGVTYSVKGKTSKGRVIEFIKRDSQTLADKKTAVEVSQDNIPF